eukprot:TRINITY_DN3116_c0_g1_i2.p1 TRINITY_DN3116_c0_g1~~TRINITY_DN3116_c0_g1_i2.p1  ORF type:complete len:403 (-),score=70.70 TRINITY_DN3116_c0_g1_i2:33-1241(-)
MSTTPKADQVNGGSICGSVIECGFVNEKGQRQYSLHCEYTGQDEEVFLAQSDPQQRKLFRATLVSKRNNLKSNKIGMYLLRSKGALDGVFSAKCYSHKRRGIDEKGKSKTSKGLKPNSYFVTEQLLTSLDQKCRDNGKAKLRKNGNNSSSKRSRITQSHPRLSCEPALKIAGPSPMAEVTSTAKRHPERIFGSSAQATMTSNPPKEFAISPSPMGQSFNSKMKQTQLRERSLHSSPRLNQGSSRALLSIPLPPGDSPNFAQYPAAWREHPDTPQAPNEVPQKFWPMQCPYYQQVHGPSRFQTPQQDPLPSQYYHRHLLLHPLPPPSFGSFSSSNPNDNALRGYQAQWRFPAQLSCVHLNFGYLSLHSAMAFDCAQLEFHPIPQQNQRFGFEATQSMSSQTRF